MKVIQNMDTEEVTVTHLYSLESSKTAGTPTYTDISEIEDCFKVAAGCNYPKCVGLDSRWRG